MLKEGISSGCLFVWQSECAISEGESFARGASKVIPLASLEAAYFSTSFQQ